MVSSRKIFFAIAFTLLSALSACQENGEPQNPNNPGTPDETRPWTFEISDLVQFPSPSTDFQNVCPVFSPDGATAYFQTTGKNVVAVDVATGQIKWQTNNLGELSYPSATTMTQPAVNPVTGEIYVNFHISKSETNVFFALDPATGRIAKKLDNIGIFAGNISGPAVTADGKYVYIGTNGATLRMIDTETFTIVGYAVSYRGFRHAMVEGDKCILIGNNNEVMVCFPNPDAAPGATLLHSEYIYGEDYFAVTTAFPCFSKDGLRIMMPSADADVFGGATPGKAFVTVIDLEAWERHNILIEGARYVWNILSDEEGCYYVTASTTPDKSAGAFVRKYSPDFGEVKWTWTVPNCFLDWAGGLQRSMPALGDDGNLYIVSRENSSVYRINTESGEGAKVFSYPAAAYPNKAQTGINICDGKLVSAFSGLRSGVIAVADIGVNPQKSWSTVVGDPCGTKSYEAAWGLPDQLSGIEIPIGPQNTYIFDAKSNSGLVSDLLKYLDKAAVKADGTPLADKFKTLKAEIVANFDSDPFEWMERVNTFVTENIAGYAPGVFDATGEPEGVELARRLLLLLRDYPLHEVSLTNDVVPMEPGQADAFNASVAKVQEAVVDKLLAWLDTPAPAPGVLELFKIYNMGYVARTADHCIGIDIYWWSSQEKMKRLCDSIEAIFVSHAHGDHFNLELLTEMSSREGKYLFMTTGTKNMFTPASAATLYAWDSSVLEPVDCDGLSVRASIGAQGDLPCQLFSIGMDGFCIWACGDNGKDTAYDVAAANFNAPHITMVSVAGAAGSINKAGRSAKGADAHDVVYVVSHENEVHHTIDGRVAYKFFFESPRTLEDNVYSKNVGKYAALDYGEILTISAAK